MSFPRFLFRGIMKNFILWFGYPAILNCRRVCLQRLKVFICHSTFVFICFKRTSNYRIVDILAIESHEHDLRT